MSCDSKNLWLHCIVAHTFESKLFRSRWLRIKMADKHPICYEIVKNVIIDFYLDCFERRIRNNENFMYVLVNRIVQIFYFLLIIKYSLSLFIEFNYEMKLYLFDLSLLFGGIYKYNNLFLLLTFIFGLTLNFKFHSSKDPDMRIWLRVFEFIRGPRQRSNFRNLGHQNLEKLIRFSHFIYKFFGLVYVILRKFILTAQF